MKFHLSSGSLWIYVCVRLPRRSPSITHTGRPLKAPETECAQQTDSIHGHIILIPSLMNRPHGLFTRNF